MELETTLATLRRFGVKTAAFSDETGKLLLVEFGTESGEPLGGPDELGTIKDEPVPSNGIERAALRMMKQRAG